MDKESEIKRLTKAIEMHEDSIEQHRLTVLRLSKLISNAKGVINIQSERLAEYRRKLQEIL